MSRVFWTGCGVGGKDHEEHAGESPNYVTFRLKDVKRLRTLGRLQPPCQILNIFSAGVSDHEVAQPILAPRFNLEGPALADSRV
jgi:hypothetical protein